MTAATGFTDSPQGGAPQAPAGQPARRLLRSRSNRVFTGVCGGIAAYLGGDATAVRLATVVLAVFTGVIPLVIVYVLTAIVLPEEGADVAATSPASVSVPSALPGQAALVFGVLLIAIGLAALAREVLRIEWDVIWPFILIGLGGLVLVAGIRR